jgi:hypothetical protein
MGLRGCHDDTPPGLLEQTMKWIATYLPTLFAAGAALSISALMSLYDGQSLLKTATGSLVCGIVTLAVAGSLEYLGLPSNRNLRGRLNRIYGRG